MWMMPLHLHVNQKSDYDDDDSLQKQYGEKKLYHKLEKVWLCELTWDVKQQTNQPSNLKAAYSVTMNIFRKKIFSF